MQRDGLTVAQDVLFLVRTVTAHKEEYIEHWNVKGRRMKFSELPVGAKYVFVDKFPDGWLREEHGEVIGQTTKDWTAREWHYKRHFHPDTGEMKFEHTGPRWGLIDSRVRVSKWLPT